MPAAAPLFQFEPADQYDRNLAANVHPSDWVNPPAQRRYNLVVVGGGTAGLVTAAGAAGLGAKVALVEKNLMGGDCLNYGCVPSKALIRAGRAAAEMRSASAYGIEPVEVRADFGRVMERKRRLRAELSAKDSARRYRDELGVDVFIGEARFTGVDTVEVDGQDYVFARHASRPEPGPLRRRSPASLNPDICLTKPFSLSPNSRGASLYWARGRSDVNCRRLFSGWAAA